jgi:outer membrane lipopolysaccharide assembly protein LptE/RlpB
VPYALRCIATLRDQTATAKQAHRAALDMQLRAGVVAVVSRQLQQLAANMLQIRQQQQLEEAQLQPGKVCAYNY